MWKACTMKTVCNPRTHSWKLFIIDHDLHQSGTFKCCSTLSALGAAKHLYFDSEPVMYQNIFCSSFSEEFMKPFGVRPFLALVDYHIDVTNCPLAVTICPGPGQFVTDAGDSTTPYCSRLNELVGVCGCFLV